MTYTYDTSHTASETNWSHGRQGHKVTGITIHHWGSSDHLSFYGIVGFLCSSRPANPTSAHYVAQGVDENGKADPRVACIVDPDDTAYHAGNWQANLTNIGIECRPHPTDADYAVVAELVRDIRKDYGNLPLYPHRHWTSTECPGTWDLAKIDALARRTQDKPSRDDTRPAPKPAPVAGPKPVHTAGLTVDGVWGKATTEALQRYLGTKADGVISSQGAYGFPIDGLQEVRNPKGSQCIAALQKILGVKADGLLGPATVKALQRRLRTPADGVISRPTSQLVVALQQALNAGHL